MVVFRTPSPLSPLFRSCPTRVKGVSTMPWPRMYASGTCHATPLHQVLSDPGQRRVYDALAKDVRFRYMRQHMMPEERGGEGALLAELHSKGIRCDSRTQASGGSGGEGALLAELHSK